VTAFEVLSNLALDIFNSDGENVLAEHLKNNYFCSHVWGCLYPGKAPIRGIPLDNQAIEAANKIIKYLVNTTTFNSLLLFFIL